MQVVFSVDKSDEAARKESLISIPATVTHTVTV